MPKVSVIIPIYNVEQYLRECMDSVINQTLRDIEILCVDDGSTDNSGQILDEYASKDNRIKVIHKNNGGYGKAMNVGLDNATGEYIGIVEPDDYINAEMFNDLYNFATQNNVDFIKSDFYKNIQEKKYKNCYKNFAKLKVPPKDGVFNILDQPEFLKRHPSIWSCLYKKKFLDKNSIRFVEASGAGWVDNLFQVQCFCLAEKIMYTSNVYYYWRVENIDKLANIEIPLIRSIEIHNWLETNSINDKNILSNLYHREIAYLRKINRVIQLKDIFKYKKLLKKYFDTLKWDIIDTERGKLEYLTKLKSHLYISIVSDKYKSLKKNLKKKR